MHSMTGQSTTNRSMTALEWGLVLTLSLLWGGSFFFVAVAVKDLPPLTIVVLRVGLAALALLALNQLAGPSMPTDRRVWAGFFGMGLLNNVIPFSLIVWGQTQIGSGLVAILNATTPLVTVLIASLLTEDERLTPGRLSGVIAGCVGVAVMIGEAALRPLGLDVLAQLACPAAVVSYAFAAVFGKRFKVMGVRPMATVAGQLTASSLMLLPVMIIVDRPWTLGMPSTATVAALIGLALLSTTVAYILYFRILATAGATNLLLVTFLIRVSVVLLGVCVLGEALLDKHLVGMALIGLGLAVIDGRLWRALRRLIAVPSSDAAGDLTKRVDRVRAHGRTSGGVST